MKFIVQQQTNLQKVMNFAYHDANLQKVTNFERDFTKSDEFRKRIYKRLRNSKANCACFGCLYTPRPAILETSFSSFAAFVLAVFIPPGPLYLRQASAALLRFFLFLQSHICVDKVEEKCFSSTEKSPASAILDQNLIIGVDFGA